MKKITKLCRTMKILIVMLSIFGTSLIGITKSEDEEGYVPEDPEFYRFYPSGEISDVNLGKFHNPDRDLHPELSDFHDLGSIDPDLYDCPFGPVECCWLRCLFEKQDNEERALRHYEAKLSYYKKSWLNKDITWGKYLEQIQNAEENYIKTMDWILHDWADCTLYCVINQLVEINNQIYNEDS